MSGKLINLINLTIIIANRLLSDTSFNVLQCQFLNAIVSEARAMLQMMSRLPDVRIEHIQRTLDFESRSHLTVIIGYCDILLDEDEGELTDIQREQVEDLLKRSYELLSYLTELSA